MLVLKALDMFIQSSMHTENPLCLCYNYYIIQVTLLLIYVLLDVDGKREGPGVIPTTRSSATTEHCSEKCQVGKVGI